MAKQTINNKFSGETGLSSRSKINSNFTELYDGKVDKETGKELSDNNFTDTLKNKLDGVEDGAEVNDTYTNSTPIEQEIGGIAIGETFVDVSIVDMFDKLLYPYQSPAFLTFSLSNGITILECGIDWSGTTNATFTFTNNSNIKPNTLSIYQDIISIISNQSVVSPKSITLITISKTTDGQYITMKVQAENTNNVIFNRSFNITWYMPYYFGVGTVGLDVAAIKSLNKTVTSKANITRAYNTNNQVPYLAYPTSRGLLTSILDKNGYETISDFTRTTRTFIINGISVQYYVYEFNNPSTANNLQISYKY